MNALSVPLKVTVMCMGASTQVLGGALAPLWDFDIVYLSILHNFLNQPINF
jgi:hypothetical protein